MSSMHCFSVSRTVDFDSEFEKKTQIFKVLCKNPFIFHNTHEEFHAKWAELERKPH